MSNTILIGAQWGDEGKGKIIDYLTRTVDVVVRTQGGNNAGHTIVIDKEKYVLSLVPSGILHRGKICVLGNGVVIDPVALFEEIAGLRKRGIHVGSDNLLISDRAHVVLPHHRSLDAQREDQRSGRIGTTKRGIGPAYADKISRTGMRMTDLVNADTFSTRLRCRMREVNRYLKLHGLKPIPAGKVEREYARAAAALRPHIVDTVSFLHRMMDKKKDILFEGAQGTFLDIDHGTYPYVTSSSTTSGGACTGSGVPPNRIDHVVGVMKAYTTRVGEGPLPTEDDALSDCLHQMGREFGAVTGRARRCGWFDGVATNFAVRVNGMDQLAVTNLDGLDGLEHVRLCVAYRLDGKTIHVPPADVMDLARCQPVYIDLPGWRKPIDQVRHYRDLPAKARTYLKKLQSLTGAPLKWISVGPGRSQTFLAG
jgi:adenylosuccinate synthase